MSFGSKSAPATFERVIYVALLTVKLQYDLDYSDDTVVFSRSTTDHIRYVRSVLRLLKDAGFTLKLKRSTFFNNRIDYLRHLIRPGKLETANQTANEACKIQVLTTVI